MHITMPPSENDQNIASIKRAIDRKASEVEKAKSTLSELQSELRGLQIALDAIGGKSNVASPYFAQPGYVPSGE